MTARWTFATLDGLETYQFSINPNAQSSPVPSRDITWEHQRTAGFTGRRAGRQPHQWEFSGVLRTQEQYDAFVLWVNKRVKIRVTTDLGQRYVVRLLTFQPAQVRGRRQAPWRHTYTMECLIFETEAVL